MSKSSTKGSSWWQWGRRKKEPFVAEIKDNDLLSLNLSTETTNDRMTTKRSRKNILKKDFNTKGTYSGMRWLFSLKSSSGLCESTPEFGEMPSNISNSMLISIDDNEEFINTLTSGKNDKGVGMFNDEDILYYPLTKEVVNKTIVNKDFGMSDESKSSFRRNDDIEPKRKNDYVGLFSIRNMRLPDAIKFNASLPIEEIKEPSHLWNVWIGVHKDSNKLKMQVKKKIYDCSSIDKLARDYAYTLEFYVHDKSQRLFIWPYGEKPPIGKLKTITNLKPLTFWIPLTIAPLCWFGTCRLLLTDSLLFQDKIVGIEWRGEDKGYWMTFHAKDFNDKYQIIHFMSELPFLMIEVCEIPEQDLLLLEKIFSACKTIENQISIIIKNT